MDTSQKQDQFHQDLKNLVEGGANMFAKSFALVKSKDDTSVNTIFVLEWFLITLGFIHSSNCLPPKATLNAPRDRFTMLYTVYDITLVITFLYIGKVN